MFHAYKAEIEQAAFEIRLRKQYNISSQLKSEEKRLRIAVNVAANLIKCLKDCGKSLAVAKLHLHQLKPKHQKTVQTCSRLIMEKMELDSINHVTDEYIQKLANDFQLLRIKSRDLEQKHRQELFQCFNNDFIAFGNVWKKEFVAKLNPVFANELTNIHVI